MEKLLNAGVVVVVVLNNLVDSNFFVVCSRVFRFVIGGVVVGGCWDLVRVDVMVIVVVLESSENGLGLKCFGKILGLIVFFFRSKMFLVSCRKIFL